MVRVFSHGGIYLLRSSGEKGFSRAGSGPFPGLLVHFPGMNRLLFTSLGWLRITAFLEGISFLLLLGVAMPLKYLAGKPEMVRHVGMVHGILFVGFLALVLMVKDNRDWPMKTAALAILASVIPFGTFWADVRLFREKVSPAE